MKKTILLVLSLCAFYSCTQSQEEKAEELVSIEVKKTLFKPETYKPVETKVDSAFTPYDSPELFDKYVVMSTYVSQMQDLENEIEDQTSSMAIWGDPYQTSFGKHEYNTAKEKLNKAQDKLDALKQKAKKIYDECAVLVNGERKFIGYKVSHNYRADNNAGQTLIGDEIFIVDKDFKTVLYRLEYDDYKKLMDDVKGEFE